MSGLYVNKSLRERGSKDDGDGGPRGIGAQICWVTAVAVRDGDSRVHASEQTNKRID